MGVNVDVDVACDKCGCIIDDGNIFCEDCIKKDGTGTSTLLEICNDLIKCFESGNPVVDYVKELKEELNKLKEAV